MKGGRAPLSHFPPGQAGSEPEVRCHELLFARCCAVRLHGMQARERRPLGSSRGGARHSGAQSAADGVDAEWRHGAHRGHDSIRRSGVPPGHVGSERSSLPSVFSRLARRHLEGSAARGRWRAGTGTPVFRPPPGELASTAGRSPARARIADPRGARPGGSRSSGPLWDHGRCVGGGFAFYSSTSVGRSAGSTKRPRCRKHLWWTSTPTDGRDGTPCGELRQSSANIGLDCHRGKADRLPSGSSRGHPRWKRGFFLVRRDRLGREEAPGLCVGRCGEGAGEPRVLAQGQGPEGTGEVAEAAHGGRAGVGGGGDRAAGRAGGGDAAGGRLRGSFDEPAAVGQSAAGWFPCGEQG